MNLDMRGGIVMILKVNKKIKDVRKLNKTIIIPEFFGNAPLDYMVAEELLKHVISNKKNPVITYGRLAEKISPDFNPRNLNLYLGNISDVCKENGLPLISSIVVNKETRLPGEGFYRYFYNGQPMSEWEEIFKKCKSEVIKCTSWQALLEAIVGE